MGLRASTEEEILGLDTTEHGLASSYADFMISTGVGTGHTVAASSAEVTKVPVPKADAVPVEKVGETISSDGTKITRLSIICKQNKFEDLKEALNRIGVMGITVTNVLGCGIQKGNAAKYRGVAVDFTLLPKVKVEVVVSKVPVEDVIEAAKNALYTGNIGDGKIFVYDVENVIKVRTGEEGYDALQGEDD